MSLKNLNLMIYHADLQPARGNYFPGRFFTKEQKKGFNGERGILGRQKVVCGSNVPVSPSHAGPNPRSCTALSLIDGRETRPRLVHASIARGITASLVSLCEAWLRDGTASYQTKALEITYGRAVYPASQVLRRECVRNHF